MTQDGDSGGGPSRAGRKVGQEPTVGRVDDASRHRLGRNLRLFYAGVLEQPLPERLTRLLDDLAAGQAGSDPKDREGSR